MATTTQIDTLFEGNNTIILHLQIYGDTNLAAASVIDLSTITFPDNRQAGHIGVDAADSFTLMEASWSIQTFQYVQLLWDHTTDDEMLTMSGDGAVSFRGVGGKHDPQTTGGTGDVLITTTGAAADASADIELVFKKKPA